MSRCELRRRCEGKPQPRTPLPEILWWIGRYWGICVFRRANIIRHIYAQPFVIDRAVVGEKHEVHMIFDASLVVRAIVNSPKA